MRKAIRMSVALGLGAGLSGCGATFVPAKPANPALEYSQSIASQREVRAGYHPNYVRSQPEPKAQLRFASGDLPPDPAFDARPGRAPYSRDGVLTNDPAAGYPGGDPEQGYYEYRSQEPEIRDYNGPLPLGDPGVTASLWQESRGGNELVRDDRAWLPMDLITIIVTESSQGSKEADTEVKSETSIMASIPKLFGIETTLGDKNTQVDFNNLIEASTANDFKGEGETTRKGNLRARISAMVAEVLPSGILRIEGEKIISVNDEEQVIRISGLVRPKDVTSANEVDSSKVANMRIDYFGRGTVGEYQSGGWGQRIIRKLWPF